MIRALYSESSHNYAVSIFLSGTSLLGLGANDRISAIFDTGATATVLSLGSLLGEDLAEAAQPYVKEYFADIPFSSFKSASGNELLGYDICLNNIRVSGTKFERFYFYLMPYICKPKALIGDDIISCCGFHHAPLKDIEADIDMNLYISRRGSMGSTGDCNELFRHFLINNIWKCL